MKKIILYLLLAFSSIGFSQSITGVNVFDIQQTSAQFLVSASSPTPCTIQLLYALSPTSAGAGTSIIHPTGSFTGSNQVTFSLTGLQAGSQYNYVVRLLNPADNSIRQTNLPNSFTTAAATAQVPLISNVSLFAGTLTSSGTSISYTINPNGQITSPVIKYGTSSTSLTSTQNCAPVSGSTAQNQLQGLAGLTPNTQYFYRVEASNSAGPAIPSATLTFTTLAVQAVPAITAVSSSNITGTGATVNYSINPNGAVATPVIKYGLTSSNLNLTQNCATVSGSNAQAQTQALSGLTAGTQYFYRVEASNSVGNATPSSTLSFTTIASQIPVITASSVTAITATTATFNYTITTNGLTTGPAVRYGTSSTNLNLGGNLNTSSSPTISSSFTATNLTPNTQYFYRVEASNMSGSAVPTAIQSFTTAAAAVTVPTISNVVLSNITSTGAAISFQINPNNGSASAQVNYSTNSSAINLNLGTDTNITSTVTLNKTFTNLLPNTTYFYQISAGNSAGLVSTTVASFTTMAPAATAPSISNVSVSNITSSTVRINYTVNANNAAATTQVLYARAPSGANPVTFVTGPNATGNANTNLFVDIAGLQPDTAYVYSISATNSVGPNSSTVFNFTTASLPVSATPTATTPQSFCNGATVANLTATGTNLKWYSSNSGGVQLAANTVLAQGFYYVSQTTGTNAESARFAVQVNVTTVTPPTVTVGPQCFGATIANVQSPANNQRWYSVANGGSQLATNTVLTTGNYYVSLVNSGGCESTRTTVPVTVTTVAAPTGAAVQVFTNANNTVANLVATGSAVQWFATNANALSNTNPLAATTAILNGSIYYAMQTVNGCRSTAPLAVTATVSLSTSEFNNLEVSLYPSPVQDILNLEMASDLRLLEIYNIQGQKVRTSATKQTNVSDLSAGIYMVRIQDENDAIATKKIIKK